MKQAIFHVRAHLALPLIILFYYVSFVSLEFSPAFLSHFVISIVVTSSLGIDLEFMTWAKGGPVNILVRTLCRYSIAIPYCVCFASVHKPTIPRQYESPVVGQLDVAGFVRTLVYYHRPVSFQCKASRASGTTEYTYPPLCLALLHKKAACRALSGNKQTVASRYCWIALTGSRWYPYFSFALPPDKREQSYNGYRPLTKSRSLSLTHKNLQIVDKKMRKMT